MNVNLPTLKMSLSDFEAGGTSHFGLLPFSSFGTSGSRTLCFVCDVNFQNVAMPFFQRPIITNIEATVQLKNT